MTTITIGRGTTQIFTVTFSDSNGNPINITGYTIYFTVKSPDSLAENDPNDRDAVIQVLAALTTPASGIATVTLTPTQTSIPAGNYLYDLKTISGSGVISVIPPVDFIVQDPVTNKQS